MTVAGGPFIVKRERECGCGASACEVVELSVKAVADLEEARKHAVTLSRDAGVDLLAPLHASLLGPEGGTVQLSDGSEIHVEATTWVGLMREAELDGPVPPTAGEQTYILERWNSRFGVSQEKEGER